jgi:hypothetical protein
MALRRSQALVDSFSGMLADMVEIVRENPLLIALIYLFLYIIRYDQGVMSGIIVMPYWTSYFNHPNDVMTGQIE